MDERIMLCDGAPVMLQYYFPFRFDDSLFDAHCDALASAAEDGSPLWREEGFPVDRNTVFYEHVLSMMNVRDNPHSVCRSWKLLKPEGSRYEFRPQDGGCEPIRFSLADVRVHLFRAGIGFIGYRTIMEDGAPLTSGQLIRFQNRIKKISRKDKELFVLPDDEGDGGPADRKAPRDGKQVRLARVVTELLPRDLLPRIRFFGEREDFHVPQAALLFSYLCYDGADRDALKEVTVHMAMGYDLGNTRSGETIRSCNDLGRDVVYYASQNGCAISAVPNEVNRSFFVSNSPAEKYHFIFFILLYQHISLLNFSIRLFEDFPSSSRSYLGNSDYADRMQDFMTDVDTFLMKNDIATVSHEQFHNLFYETCRRAMRIEEDKQSLRSGFESLASIQRSRQLRDREEQEQLDQEKQEKFSHTVEYLAIILGLIEILSEVVSFIQRAHLLLTRPSALSATDYIAMGLFLAVAFIVIFLIVKIFRLRPVRRKK